MEGLEEKLSSMLSSPETMEKVKNLMQVLGSSASRGESPSEEPERPEVNQSVSGASDDAPDAGALSSLLGMLGGLSGSAGSSGGSELSALAGVDPKMLTGLLGLLGEYNKKDDTRENLIMALKPYLRAERQDKIERAAQIMRLARTARSGFSTFLGGGDRA